MSTDDNALITTEHVPPVFGGPNPKSLAKLRPIIESAFEAWLKKHNSEKTRTAYRNDVRQFLDYHGLDPNHIEWMTRIGPEDVGSWRDHLKKTGGRAGTNGEITKAKDSTVARKITALRSFFSYLQVAGYRGGNPAHPNFVKVPAMPDVGLTPEIPPKQLINLLGAPEIEDEEGKKLPLGIRDRGWLALLPYMGLRIEELSLINVGNIKTHGNHTVIEIKGKGDTTRLGVVPPKAATPLNAWIEYAGIENDRSGPLFRPGKSARGLGRDGFKRARLGVRLFQKRMEQYCADIGIDQAVTVHSCRVSAATEAHRAGIPLDSIQRWLGHKDPRTTLRYIRTGEDLDNSPAYALNFGATRKQSKKSAVE